MKRRTKAGDRIRRNPGKQRDNVVPLHRKEVEPEDDEQSIERNILAALITRTDYIDSVKSFWRSDLFPEEWMRLVAIECMKYYKQYKQAPQEDIEPWFEDRLKSDPERRKTLQVFLQNLRRDYNDGSSINVDYVVDRTKDYVQKQEQLRYGEKYLDLVKHGEPDKAYALKPPQIDFDDAPKEVIALSDVKRKRVKWLIPHLLPCGYLTLLAGVKGRGKTLLALGWAAQLSCGKLGPRDSRSIGDTLVITTEDETGDMMGPRFDVAGGDDRRIWVVQGVTTRDDDGQVVVDLWDTKNVAKLRQWLDAYPETKLVLIDPISAHMPDAKGRSSENVQVRRAIAPLAKLAAEREIAIILTTHTRKGHEGTAIEKIIDSTAYVALSRMVIVMGRNPDDPDNTRKGIAAVAESNLTAERLSFEYRLDSIEHPTVGEQPILVPGDVSPITADELLLKPKKPEERLLHEEMEDWAREQLADGWMSSNILFEDGKKRGYSRDQIYRVLHKIGARRKKKGFKDSKWGWRLPKPRTSR